MKRVLLALALVLAAGDGRAATVTDIDIDQGATWTKAWKTNRVLTGCTLDMEIRDVAGGTLFASPLPTITSAARGEFTTTLTAAQTAALVYSGDAVYDVEAACSGGVVYRLFQGTARLNLGVTTGEVEPGSWPVGEGGPGELYLRIADAATTYLSQADAAATYLSHTTAPLTLYVTKTGSDSNACTQIAPCLTIQKAVDAIPHEARHAVTVNLGAGTWTEQVRVTKLIAPTGSVQIVGTLAAFTPATGLASGTIASFSGRTATVTGAGWTVNNLRDKFLRTTADGELYPIASNTATTVEVAYSAFSGSLAGKAFDIVEPSTIVNGGTSAGDVAFWINQTGVGKEIFSPLTESDYGLLLRNMEIVARTGVRSSASVKVYGCRLKYNEYGVLLETAHVAQVFRSVILEQSSLGGAGVFSTWAILLDVAGSYLRGMTGGHGVWVGGTNYYDVSSAGNVIEGHTYGYRLEGVLGGAEHYSLLRNNTYGVFLAGPGNVSFTSTTITGNTYGIHQVTTEAFGSGSLAIGLSSASVTNNTLDGIRLNDYASLKMGEATITGNGAHGITVEGAHCSVEANGSTSISNNAGIGVRTGYLGSFANIYVASSCTMSGNGADFSLDNQASNFSRATCTAAAGNTKIEATKYFNRAFCP